MSGFPRQGRPPLSEGCVDCFRAGLPLSERGEKQYGSYCAKHYYKRMKAGKIRKSVRKEVLHGFWSELPENAYEVLAQDCRDNVGKTMKRLDDKRRARALAFEWACMELALIRKRRITIAEEDQIIAAFEGSRDGMSMSPVGPDGQRDAVGPILLPDPDVRRSHRADLLGGPTTDGEPDLETYYMQHKGRELPDDLRILDKNFVIASDGNEVHKDFLETYEAALKAGTLTSPVEVEEGMSERDVLQAVKEAKKRDDSAWEEDGVPPDVNTSFSQMWKEAE